MNTVHLVAEHYEDESFIKKLFWRLMPMLALAAAVLAHCAT